MTTIRLGTRNSALAQWQAQWVAARLLEHGVTVEIVPVATTGDRDRSPLATIGGQGVFTKEIQRALVDGHVDLAVHSLKDLPTEKVPGLTLAAVPKRGPVGDILVTRSSDCRSIESLPRKAIVGTGSLRRRAQLLHARRDLLMADLRGNVETRLKKLEQGDLDAVVLAEAGLRRLGFLVEEGTSNRPSGLVFSPLLLEVMLPAVGQGALGLETREDDPSTRQFVELLNHRDTHRAVLAERAMLAALQGGCLAPIAALGQVQNGALALVGRALDQHGDTSIEATRNAPLAQNEQAEELGRQVAQELARQGAGKLIERNATPPM